jgi:hypothetical protein
VGSGVSEGCGVAVGGMGVAVAQADSKIELIRTR